MSGCVPKHSGRREVFDSDQIQEAICSIRASIKGVRAP
jgi:hypothetical protein